MTGNQIKELCIKNGVTYLPHHDCEICGSSVGWYLLGRWPPYEVAFDSSCGCGFGHSDARPDTWENVAKWVSDESGELRAEYRRFFPVMGIDGNKE